MKPAIPLFVYTYNAQNYGYTEHKIKNEIKTKTETNKKNTVYIYIQMSIHMYIKI